MRIFLKMTNFINSLFKSITSNTNNQKRKAVIWLLSFPIFVVIISVILSVVLNQFEDKTRTNAINILHTALNSSTIEIKDIWAKGLFNDATIWAKDPNLTQNTKELLKKSGEPSLLLQSKELVAVRTYFKERLNQHNAVGFFIIAPNFISLASMRNENVGAVNLIAIEHKDRLEKVLKGHNQIIPPMASNIPLRDKKGNIVVNYPTMFVVVPIKDTDGSVIAALSIRLNPLTDFTLMTQSMQLGTSGETYIVSKDGKLLTESRFRDHLYKIGLLERGEYSMLNVEIRDPGVKLLESTNPIRTQKELPFTYALEQMLKEKTGFSKISYRDYRGVKVLGAWHWDDDLDIGFITEIDEDDVLKPYMDTRFLTVGLLSITVFLMLVIGYFNLKNNLKHIKVIEHKERYFRSLLNNAIDGIVIINTKGFIEIFNQTATQIFGYTPDEVIGKNVSMLTNKNDRKHHDKYVLNYLETKIPKIIGIGREVTGVRKDGSLFPMRLGISEINVENRLVFMGMITDLTKEKETEKILHEVQETLKWSFNQTPVATIIIDLDSRINKMNEAFCALLGYSREELMNLNIEYITHPDDIQQSIEKVANINKGESSRFTVEKRYIKKNGDLIWAKVKVSNLKDKSGTIKGRIVVIEDITLRKKTEEILKQRSEELELSIKELSKSKKAALNIMQDANSEKTRAENALKRFSEEKELSEQTINSMPGIFFICDKTGKLFRWNNQYERLTKRTHNEIIKAHAFDIIDKEDRALAINSFTNITKAINVELKIKSTKGVTPYLFTIMPTEISGKEYRIGTGINISELKNTEISLQRSEARLNYLISSNPVAIYTSKTVGDFGITFVGANVKQLFDYPPNKFTDNSEFWINNVHPDDKQKFLEEIPELFKHGFHIIEYRFKHRSGSYLWVHDEMRLIYNDDGTVREIIGYWANINDRKKTEEEIKKLNHAIEQSLTTIVITDKAGVIEYVNPAFTTSSGYSFDEGIGHPSSILKSGKHGKEFYENLWKTILSGKTWRGDIINKKKSGEEYWESTSISPIFNDKDEITHFVAVKEDITERKLLENELIKSKEQVEALYHVSKELSSTLSLKEVLSLVLSELKNVLSFDSGTVQVLKGDYFEIVAVSGFLSPEKVLHKSFRLDSDIFSKIEKDQKKTIIIKDTRSHHLFKDLSQTKSIRSTMAVPLIIDDNHIGRITLDKNKVDYFNLEHSQQVTAFASNAAIAVKNARLFEESEKSKIEANNANKAKSNFLANMSHEIRTPMNAILGFSEILSKHIKDQTQLQYIESIRSSGNTLLTLINDILDLSKIESGKFDFNYEAINVKTLVQEVVNMFTVKAIEKGLELNMVINKNLPRVLFIDELRIKQILINLINNAIKFTNQGSIEVAVTFLNNTGKSLNLILKIKDTGIGIPKKDHKRIFQAFDQMDMMDNKNYEGTGLGLAITQQFVKLMNGKIELTSKKGEGSTFTITLEKVNIGKEDIKAEEKIEFDSNLIEFEKSTVLIVDDIKTNRDLLKEYIKGYGINIVEAENGQEALIAIKKHNPDLIFLDLRMPNMNGVETNDAIKKTPEWSHIPIVAFTASVFDKDERKALDQGFNDFIRKPVSATALLNTLKRYIKYSIVADSKETISNIIFKPIANLEDLILEIEKKVMPLWEDIKIVRQKKKVLLLANVLLEIGKKYKVAPLINYGEDLHMACKLFNITKEKELIQQFPHFIENLNSQHNGK